MSWLLNAHVSGHSSSDNYGRVWFHCFDRVEASVRMYVITPLICVCRRLKLLWCQVAPLPLTNICCPELIYPSMVLVNPIYLYIHCNFPELLRWYQRGRETSERLRRSRLSLRMHSLGCFGWFLPQGKNTDWRSCGCMWISLVRLMGVLETFFHIISFFSHMTLGLLFFFFIFWGKSEWY